MIYKRATLWIYRVAVHDHPEDHDADLALGLGLLEAQLREAALPQPRQRWLARRGLGVGCSELPAVWLALGLATVDEKARARRYIEQQAMRVIAAKARQAKMPKVSTDARLGRLRETPLFKTWRERLAAGDYVSEVERLVDHRTVVHIEGHPTLQRLLPLVDRHERRLIDSTDAIALLVDKRFAVVQGKCTVEPTDVPPPARQICRDRRLGHRVAGRFRDALLRPLRRRELLS